MQLTKAHARKVLEMVDAGLIEGVGKAVPGQMCVEAAVCFALGLPHGDNPPCVGMAVRAFKISLNDAQWSSNAARTKGLRKLAIAQLGSDTIDQRHFAEVLAKLTIQRLLSFLFRELAAKPHYAKHKTAFLEVAEQCEREGTEESACMAQKAATAAANAAANAAYATKSATTSSAAAAAYDAATAAAYDAATAAYAATAAANAAAYAAYATKSATAAAAAAATGNAGDTALFLMADIGLEALKACESPGCQWLDVVA